MDYCWANQLAGWCLFAISFLLQSGDPGIDRTDPTVGAAGWISQIILPGSELQAKPLDTESPIVVRIQEAFAHGDSFRYELQFHGLEPGEYNIADWLERKDGSDTDDLPEIPVTIKSLLPPGQIEPNPLEQGLLPRLGGYRFVAIAAVVLWTVVLLGLIFVGRKRKSNETAVEEKITLAQLLRPRLAAATRNEIEPHQYAELERMLFAFWRKRLGLESETADKAMQLIKADSDAGPLMKQLEVWMHDPRADRNVDLGQLLKPYEKFPVDDDEATA